MAKRILIVEDNAPTREILCKLVSDRHYDVSEAADGDDAIEAIKRGNIDGMLLDLLMPNRDGIEVLVWLKSEYPGMPVVVMTQAGGGHDISYPEIAERFGAARAFRKPVTAKKVVEALSILEETWAAASS
ncbi:MAG: response regulator [Rhodospirillales bacterium]|nr:response regulator [Rhodospirillales bacterium]MBO6785267.1 response regulator [Rhodospirillales bacterium]